MLTLREFLLKFRKILLVVIFILFNFISLAESSFALGNLDASSDSKSDAPKLANYLSSQLEQLLKFSAPNNQGLEYFILPDETELDKIPADPHNTLTPEKIELGKNLFHETALTINPLNARNWQQGSCATCHFAQAGFKSNLPLALGVGAVGWNRERRPDPKIADTEVDRQRILTPSVLNSAYQSAMLWNGRAGVYGTNARELLIQNFEMNHFGLDGLETQAIDAMDVHRMGTAAIATISEYQKLFAQAFPSRPYVGAEVEDIVQASKAIAAYERTLLTNQAPFQKWLRGDKSAMSIKEIKGAITFFSSTCVKCHTGPNLGIDGFKAVGFADHPREYGQLSLGRGTITQRAEDDFKFKVPQLYNLADSSPYGHGASFKTIREVVEYFNVGVPQKLEVLYSGNLSVLFHPLNLTEEQISNLTAFLETGLRDPNLLRYVPEQLPSGLCFPNNDPESQKQLNCD